MWPRRPLPRFVSFRSARRWLPGGVGLLLLAFGAGSARHFSPAKPPQLLQKADRIKTAYPAEFTTMLNSLAARLDELTRASTGAGALSAGVEKRL